MLPDGRTKVGLDPVGSRAVLSRSSMRNPRVGLQGKLWLGVCSQSPEIHIKALLQRAQRLGSFDPRIRSRICYEGRSD